MLCVLIKWEKVISDLSENKTHLIESANEEARENVPHQQVDNHFAIITSLSISLEFLKHENH
jgi:hypothetical protein